MSTVTQSALENPIASLESTPTGVSITWMDRHRSFFHYLCLRDCCYLLDEMDVIVGFRFHTRTAAPLDVPMSLLPAVYSANHELSVLMMDASNHVRFRLEAGDAVLFDNHRVMARKKERVGIG